MSPTKETRVFQVKLLRQREMELRCEWIDKTRKVDFFLQVHNFIKFDLSLCKESANHNGRVAFDHHENK